MAASLAKMLGSGRSAGQPNLNLNLNLGSRFDSTICQHAFQKLTHLKYKFRFSGGLYFDPLPSWGSTYGVVGGGGGGVMALCHKKRGEQCNGVCRDGSAAGFF